MSGLPGSPQNGSPAPSLLPAFPAPPA
ncbi:hypothetical protein ECEC1736_0631, partial [Escherichia coli EC1736]